MGRKYPPPLERFMAKVQKTDNCWLWTGPLSPLGYGYFSLNAKTVGAHRAAWTLLRGEIPKGMLICHRCDNPKCVNPDHLFVGTDYDNNIDCIKKGRHITPFKWRQKTLDGVKLCQKGLHKLEGANLWVYPDGKYRCRECHRIYQRERSRRLKALRVQNKAG